MAVVALQTTRPCVPHLHRPIFGAGHHPFSFAMKSHPGDVVRVPIKRHDGVRVRRLDIVEFDIVMACGRQKALIGSDAKTIHLGIWVLDGSRADARQSLPEAVFRILISPDGLQPLRTQWQPKDKFKLTEWYGHTPLANKMVSMNSFGRWTRRCPQKKRLRKTYRYRG